MIKVVFEERKISLALGLSLYSSLNPVPFSLTWGNIDMLPETIYARNLNGENFIEFRFNKDTKLLYEISMVAIDSRSVVNMTAIGKNNINTTLFNCIIDEDNSQLDNSDPVTVYRSNDAIEITWSTEGKQDISYFSLSPNCSVGTDHNLYLVSVVLSNLTEDQIFDVFGF